MCAQSRNENVVHKTKPVETDPTKLFEREYKLLRDAFMEPIGERPSTPTFLQRISDIAKNSELPELEKNVSNFVRFFQKCKSAHMTGRLTHDEYHEGCQRAIRTLKIQLSQNTMKVNLGGLLDYSPVMNQLSKLFGYDTGPYREAITQIAKYLEVQQRYHYEAPAHLRLTQFFKPVVPPTPVPTENSFSIQSNV